MASTTEITSAEIQSDNPVHQRLLKAYYAAPDYLPGGRLLEIGCGVGRGIDILKSHFAEYHAVDKNEELIGILSEKHPEVHFETTTAPLLSHIEDNFFDAVVTFQVIEHIKNDLKFVEEIHRVLKPGGKALITTPNKDLSLTRNPWHIREYTPSELEQLCADLYSEVIKKGVQGNEKVQAYYQENKEAVEKITKWDIFNLQYRLPAGLLKVPYEILNRLNRNNLDSQNNELVQSIHYSDYEITDNPDHALDLFYILVK